MSIRLTMVLTLIALQLAVQPARAAPRDRIYFVAVGVKDYVDEAHYADHQGAVQSVDLVAERLAKLGAKDGVRLASVDGKLVTRDDVFNAVAAVAQRARRDPRSVLIVYFTGHGVGEGVAWTQLLITGDYVGVPDMTNLDQEERRLLVASSLAEAIDKTGLPYLVLFDTCRTGREESFASPVLTPMATESLRQVASVLRHMNEFHEPNPILFSTKPGTSVKTVVDPLDAEAPFEVGPLARRFAIATNDVANGTRKSMSLAELVRAMTDPKLDPLTAPAISFAKGVATTSLFRKAPGSTGTLRYGSGYPALSTRPAATSSQDEQQSVRIKSTGVSTSTLSLKRTPQNFLAPKDVEITSAVFTAVTDRSRSWLEISVSDKDEVPLASLELRASAGVIRTGKIVRAERAGFAPQGVGGFSLSVDGRACNELAATIDVNAIHWSKNGALEKFDAAFTISCDASPAAPGTVHFVAMH